MLEQVAQGSLRKMQARLEAPVNYKIPIGDSAVAISASVGKTIRLHYTGTINCVHCAKAINKSFNQGYCYGCFQKLAQCDICIMQPEKCHYDQGTCREPSWGEQFCQQDHIIYLANSSGVKVGITRATQVPTRWIDQGAIQALPIMRVRSRLQSGTLEVMFKKYVADKTNWRTMLKGNVDAIDLEQERQRLLALCKTEIDEMVAHFGPFAISIINGVSVIDIDYPVRNYPQKVVSLNFDKQATVEGVLEGIKGQYLILDTGVINLRKFSGYNIQLSLEK